MPRRGRNIQARIDHKEQSASLARWDPSPSKIVRGMLKLARVGSKDIVYDLGCGDARILIMAVKKFGARKAIGYEIRQDLYEGAMKEIQNQNLQNRITLIRDDLLNADLSEASVITLYLFPTANEILRPKLENEARFATRVVSHDYPIETWQAADTAVCSTGNLYLYVIPQAFQSSLSDKTANHQ